LRSRASNSLPVWVRQAPVYFEAVRPNTAHSCNRHGVVAATHRWRWTLPFWKAFTFVATVPADVFETDRKRLLVRAHCFPSYKIPRLPRTNNWQAIWSILQVSVLHLYVQLSFLCFMLQSTHFITLNHS